MLSHEWLRKGVAGDRRLSLALGYLNLHCGAKVKRIRDVAVGMLVIHLPDDQKAQVQLLRATTAHPADGSPISHEASSGLCRRREQHSEYSKQVRALFDAIDTDGKGYLNGHDLRRELKATYKRIRRSSSGRCRFE